MGPILKALQAFSARPKGSKTVRAFYNRARVTLLDGSVRLVATNGYAGIIITLPSSVIATANIDDDVVVDLKGPKKDPPSPDLTLAVKDERVDLWWAKAIEPSGIPVDSLEWTLKDRANPHSTLEQKPAEKSHFDPLLFGECLSALGGLSPYVECLHPRNYYDPYIFTPNGSSEIKYTALIMGVRP